MHGIREFERMEAIRWQRLSATAVIILLASCGGGGSSSSSGDTSSGPPPPVTNASPGGIWRGTESTTGLQIVGLVDESGEFQFIRSDDVQYVGTASVAANSISANFQGFTQLGTVFSDNSNHGTGTVTGTVQARSSLSLTTQFKTDAGTSISGTLNLTFDTLYNRASSLSTISGNYSSGNVVVTLGSNGSIFAQDPTTGCVLNGTVSIINATYNAYKVQFSYANCTGQSAGLNGVQFSGLATLDNTQTPEHVIVGVTAKSGNVEYAAVLDMPRT
jgi:hypothetical protein